MPSVLVYANFPEDLSELTHEKRGLLGWFEIDGLSEGFRKRLPLMKAGENIFEDGIPPALGSFAGQEALALTKAPLGALKLHSAASLYDED
jgi:hypothetical protein